MHLWNYTDISLNIMRKGKIYSLEIGELSFIGIGATIIQGIKIGKNVTIGAGSVVIDNLPDNIVAVGNPTKVIKKK